MKIIFLGTCSGTEPYPDRKHTSVLFETGENLYMFDAGEGCSHTAHNMGIDLLKLQKIMLSHPHMDHVGGLANLLWVIRKLRYYYKRPILHDIEIYSSSAETVSGAMQILKNTEGLFECDYKMTDMPISDGLLFENADMKVTAMHNNHLKYDEKHGWLSYSFLIEAEDKKIVYSGDIKHISELDGWLDCDALLVETGHHVPCEIAAYAKEHGVKKLYFMHHGRTILHDPDGQLRAVREIFGENVFITDDGMVIEI